MDLNLIRRLHELADRLGVKPAVVDTFVAAVALILFNWLAVGEPFDVEGLKLAVGLLILGVVGVAAPPAAGVTHEAVLEAKPDLKVRSRP